MIEKKKRGKTVDGIIESLKILHDIILSSVLRATTWRHSAFEISVTFPRLYDNKGWSAQSAALTHSSSRKG